MKKEEFVILTLCMMILFLTGILETMYVTVLPYVILGRNSEINQFNSNCSINNRKSIYNLNSSIKVYIDKKVSVITSVKYITRVSFGPIPGMLIDKNGCLKIIILGLTIEFCSIFISYFSYDRILLHSIMRIFDAGALVCMNTSSFALIWTVFHKKGTHPIYLGILNMLYTFGTFVGPYIATFLNSYLGFIYLPVFNSFIFSFCLVFWTYIFISSKRNQKYIDIIYNTATDSHDCAIEENGIYKYKSRDQISGDEIINESNSNNNDKNDENINVVESNKYNIISHKSNEYHDNSKSINNDENITEQMSSCGQYNSDAIITISDEIQSEEKSSYNKTKTKHQKVTFASFFLFFRLLCNPYVFLCFLGIFTSQMSVTLFSSTVPMWMIQKYKVSQRKAGLVWLPGSIISLIVPIMLIIVFKRWSKLRFLGTLLTSFMQGIACIIMPFYPQYWNIAFTILTSVTNILMNEYVYFPMIFDIITDKYGVELSGRSSIITNMAVSSGMLLGSLTAAPLVNIIGFPSFYISIGALYINVSLLNIFMKKYST